MKEQLVDLFFSKVLHLNIVNNFILLYFYKIIFLLYNKNYKTMIDEEI